MRPRDSALSCLLVPGHADDDPMARALFEAEKGVGRTSPNPAVGAVIVKGGRVLAVGHHRRAGTDHAEKAALKHAKRSVQGATMYVTLEPCDHTGRTGPCTESIIAAGIARVVVAQKDPNPLVNGRGLRRLRRAGLDVEVLARGPHRDRAEALLRPFRTAVVEGRPYFVGKIATTLDGHVAARPGVREALTGPAAWQLVHRLRDHVDAILVGRGTCAVDTPRLTARPKGGRRARHPRRVVLDGRLRLDPGAPVFDGHPADKGPPLVFCTRRAPAARRARLAARGVEVVVADADTVPFDFVREQLHRRQVQTVLVEPGPTLMGTLVEHAALDELFWLRAPKLAGPGGAGAALIGGGPRAVPVGLLPRHHQTLGDDALTVWVRPS